MRLELLHSCMQLVYYFITIVWSHLISFLLRIFRKKAFDKIIVPVAEELRLALKSLQLWKGKIFVPPFSSLSTSFCSPYFLSLSLSLSLFLWYSLNFYFDTERERMWEYIFVGAHRRQRNVQTEIKIKWNRNRIVKPKTRLVKGIQITERKKLYVIH